MEMAKRTVSPSASQIALVCARLLLVCTVLAAVGCQGPALKERDASGLPSDLVQSQAVIYAIITSIQKASWVHESKINRGPVQLFRLKVVVANVLKGEIADGKLDIYFYEEMGSEGGIGRFNFSPYHGYIFYLQKEAGVWRTSCDYYAHCADLVLTGAHPHFRRNPARPIADDILDLLFTREDGAGVSDGTMVDAIGGKRNYGRHWADERMDDFVKLLEKTVQTESPTVPTAACEQLRIYGKPCKPCEAENVLNGRFPQ
jgi:hypothetical protein